MDRLAPLVKLVVLAVVVLPPRRSRQVLVQAHKAMMVVLVRSALQGEAAVMALSVGQERVLVPPPLVVMGATEPQATGGRLRPRCTAVAVAVPVGPRMARAVLAEVLMLTAKRGQPRTVVAALVVCGMAATTLAGRALSSSDTRWPHNG